MNYRPEIDGLRALSVIPVILFHAGVTFFDGGYIGVDIFFVISGYLITSIILNEIEQKKFSLLIFYERRAKRILPVLLFISLVCIPIAWIILLPKDMKDFAESLIAVSTFTSNFLFWSESGYFDTSVEYKPLIHTWSLAVEEQYYILFPLFLLLVYKFKPVLLVPILTLIFFCSLIFSHWAAYNMPSANFYLLPTRGWEILLGVLAAFSLRKYNLALNPLISNAITIFGLMLIIFSIFYYDKHTPFPSLYTLLPTTGVLLIILFSNKNSLVTKFLSLKPLVGMGLISYSAYLWHQPILAFIRNLGLEIHSTKMIILILSSTIFLSFLSWRFIETPSRKSSGAYIKYVLLSAILFTFTVGAIFTLNPYFGLDKNQKEKVMLLENFMDTSWNHRESFNNKTEGKRLLIIGDSLAEDFHKSLYLYEKEIYDQLDVVTIKVKRRCKNVLSDTENLNNYLFDSDVHCIYGPDNIRIGDKKYDDLISNADLIIVRSYWDYLPTLEMPNLYDYIESLNPGKSVFLGLTVFGNLKWPSKSSFINETSRLISPHEVNAYSVNSEVKSVDLIDKANEIMKGRRYIDVQKFFCQSKYECNIYTNNGNLITPDGQHLTKYGKKILIESLFNDVQFNKIFKKLDLKFAD